MPDREKVIKALEFCTNQRIVDTCYGECPYAVADDEYKCLEMKLDALALLKEQDELINELLNLGYPHNFQHEAPWVVDYLYSLTEIIKKAFKAKEM